MKRPSRYNDGRFLWCAVRTLPLTELRSEVGCALRTIKIHIWGPYMSSLFKLLLLPIMMTVFAACSQTPTIKSEPAPEFAADGLHPVNASGFTAAYVLPGANLPSYRAVNIRPMKLDEVEISQAPVATTLRRDWQMTPERITALQETWSRSMARAFGTYAKVGQEDAGLGVSAEITRIAPGRPTATTIGGGVQPVGSSQDVIEVFVEFRLYDQEGGRLLAVIRDSRTMLSIAMSRTAPAAIQTMFNSWAALLHTRVSGR